MIWRGNVLDLVLTIDLVIIIEEKLLRSDDRSIMRKYNYSYVIILFNDVCVMPVVLCDLKKALFYYSIIIIVILFWCIIQFLFNILIEEMIFYSIFWLMMKIWWQYWNEEE